MQYLLGIDLGSSAAKVGLFDPAGEALAVASHSYATLTPQPGYKEQNPADWWQAVQQGVRSVAAGVPPASILAVGITGHISSLTFLDADGSPLRPSIGFQDQRAVAEVQELYRQYERAELAELLDIDLPPAPNWPLPRLLWMRKHQPQVLDRTHHLLQAKDYINLRLTGNFASDFSSNRGMVDFSVNRPAEIVLSRLRLPNLLPPLFSPEQIIGEVTRLAAEQTGLRAGLPVVAGWNDLNACVLGSGVVQPGQAFDVTGTSEHIGVVSTLQRASQELLCAPYLPGSRLLYGVTSSGGGSLEWFSRFSGKPVEELLSAARNAESEVLFLPYLEGERSPLWDPHASGTLLGLRSTHGEGHVVRAILEGVAFSLRQILEGVERLSPDRPETVIVSGGASRARLWNQIKANVLGKNMATLKSPHAGILGAAMLAAVAAKLFSDPETASIAMTRAEDHYRPVSGARTHIDRMYSLYCESYPALRDIYSRLDAGTLIERQETSSVTHPSAVIFGAGKIARGFIAHLLTLSGYQITFVEKNPALASLLRERGKYRVQIMGAAEKSATIQDFKVLQSDETGAVAAAVANAAVVFVSIGGPNLPQVAPLLAAGLERRRSEGKAGLNIILGENYFQPARWLRTLIAEELPEAARPWFLREVGIVETMILRSTIEPTAEMRAADPLSLKAQDMWEMPADKEAFVGGVPEIQGLSPQENFQGGLIRKLFTYNCINAVIAYTGHLRGYTLLSEAANDPEILVLARAAYGESNGALCSKFGFTPEDQLQFAEAAIAKYQKKEIVDPIERNARDPLRKLSRNDRLIGPASLALEYGAEPAALSRAIAAALLYERPEDPSSLKLQQSIREKGVGATIQEVCGIESTGKLATMILAAYERLAQEKPRPLT